MKQKIRWVKSIEEQSNRKESFSQKVLAVLPSAAFSVFFALIFMIITIWAVVDAYEELHWDGGYIVLALLLFFVTSVIEELILYGTGKRKGLLSVGVLCAIVGGYGVRLLLAEKDGQLWGETPEGVYQLFLFVFLVVLWLAKILRKNSLFIVPTGVVLVMLLWEGHVPGKGVLFFVIAGILLCCAGSWEKADMQTSFLRGNRSGGQNHSPVWLVRSVVLCAVCGIILWLGSGPAQRIVESHGNRVVSLASGLTREVADWAVWEKLDLPPSLSSMAATMFREEALDQEMLSNNAPKYTQTEVLRVESSQPPVENVYLRGFCGDIYADGSWQRDLVNLEKTCLEEGREYDAARAQIAFFTVRKLQGQTNTAEAAQNPNLGQIRVHYTGLISEQVYYPYFAMVTTKGIGLVGDSGFTKNKKLETVSFDQWWVSQEELPDMTSERTAWDTWYGTYLEKHYLEVPAELTVVGEIAAQIEAARMLEEDELTGEEGLAASGQNVEEMANATNKERLSKAQAVADWLAQNTTYSLNPPTLAEGTDPIAYFLSTSKTGYCMHYASAAVMLLRELQVPARYASGYMVEADAFASQEGYFSAGVLDDRAHAWVEIYLDTIGWVPVEVTKGYPVIEATRVLSEKLQVKEVTGDNGESSGAGSAGESAESEIIGEIVQNPEEEKTEDTRSQEETPEVQEGEHKSDDEEDTSEEEASEDEMSEDVESDEEQSQQDQEGDEQTEEDVQEPTEEKKIVMVTPQPTDEEDILADTKATTRRIIIYILCGLVVIGIVIALVADTHIFFGRESVYYKQLRKEMKRGNHKRVIMMINSGVYRKLHFKKLVEEGSGDEAYAKALKDNYKQLSEEEWDRYMAIVKQVAFSKAEFTEEDVKFCFDVYRDVIYKDEVW